MQGRRDERAWAAATWSLPLVIQLVLAAALSAMWVLERAGLHNDTRDGQRTMFLLGIGVAFVASVAAGGILMR